MFFLKAIIFYASVCVYNGNGVKVPIRPNEESLRVLVQDPTIGVQEINLFRDLNPTLIVKKQDELVEDAIKKVEEKSGVHDAEKQKIMNAYLERLRQIGEDGYSGIRNRNLEFYNQRKDEPKKINVENKEIVEVKQETDDENDNGKEESQKISKSQKVFDKFISIPFENSKSDRNNQKSNNQLGNNVQTLSKRKYHKDKQPINSNEPEIDEDNYQEPISYHEDPGPIPTKVNYPGQGQWARKGRKHKPHETVHKHLYPDTQHENINKNGEFEIYDHNKNIYDEEREGYFNNLKKYSEGYNTDDTNHEEEPQDFVPYRTYSQVRRSDVERRIPKKGSSSKRNSKKKKDKRLKEIQKNSKAHTVYTEEGYEDSAYDHGGTEKKGDKVEKDKRIHAENQQIKSNEDVEVPQRPEPPGDNSEDESENDEILRQDRYEPEKEESESRVNERRIRTPRRKIKEENKENKENKEKDAIVTREGEPSKYFTYENEDWFQKYRFDNINDYFTLPPDEITTSKAVVDDGKKEKNEDVLERAPLNVGKALKGNVEVKMVDPVRIVQEKSLQLPMTTRKPKIVEIVKEAPKKIEKVTTPRPIINRKVGEERLRKIQEKRKMTLSTTLPPSKIIKRKAVIQSGDNIEEIPQTNQYMNEDQLKKTLEKYYMDSFQLKGVNFQQNPQQPVLVQYYQQIPVTPTTTRYEEIPRRYYEVEKIPKQIVLEDIKVKPVLKNVEKNLSYNIEENTTKDVKRDEDEPKGNNEGREEAKNEEKDKIWDERKGGGDNEGEDERKDEVRKYEERNLEKETYKKNNERNRNRNDDVERRNHGRKSKHNQFFYPLLISRKDLSNFKRKPQPLLKNYDELQSPKIRKKDNEKVDERKKIVEKEVNDEESKSNEEGYEEFVPILLENIQLFYPESYNNEEKSKNVENNGENGDEEIKIHKPEESANILNYQRQNIDEIVPGKIEEKVGENPLKIDEKFLNNVKPQTFFPVVTKESNQNLPIKEVVNEENLKEVKEIKYPFIIEELYPKTRINSEIDTQSTTEINPKINYEQKDLSQSSKNFQVVNEENLKQNNINRGINSEIEIIPKLNDQQISPKNFQVVNGDNLKQEVKYPFVNEENLKQQVKYPFVREEIHPKPRINSEIEIIPKNEGQKDSRQKNFYVVNEENLKQEVKYPFVNKEIDLKPRINSEIIPNLNDGQKDSRSKNFQVVNEENLKQEVKYPFVNEEIDLKPRINSEITPKLNDGQKNSRPKNFQVVNEENLKQEVRYPFVNEEIYLKPRINSEKIPKLNDGQKDSRPKNFQVVNEENLKQEVKYPFVNEEIYLKPTINLEIIPKLNDGQKDSRPKNFQVVNQENLKQEVKYPFANEEIYLKPRINSEITLKLNDGQKDSTQTSPKNFQLERGRRKFKHPSEIQSVAKENEDKQDNYPKLYLEDREKWKKTFEKERKVSNKNNIEDRRIIQPNLKINNQKSNPNPIEFRVVYPAKEEIEDANQYKIKIEELPRPRPFQKPLELKEDAKYVVRNQDHKDEEEERVNKVRDEERMNKDRDEERINKVRDEERINKVRDQERVNKVRDEKRINNVRDEERINKVIDEERSRKENHENEENGNKNERNEDDSRKIADKFEERSDKEIRVVDSEEIDSKEDDSFAISEEISDEETSRENFEEGQPKSRKRDSREISSEESEESQQNVRKQKRFNKKFSNKSPKSKKINERISRNPQTQHLIRIKSKNEENEDDIIENVMGEEMFGRKLNRKKRSVQIDDEIEKKYPNYNSKNFDKSSGFRYAENPETILTKTKNQMVLYDRVEETDCPQTEDINPINNKTDNKTEYDPKTRIKGKLSNQIDCLKKKYFGENPLDNPIFSEEDDSSISRLGKSESLPKAEPYVMRRRIIKRRPTPNPVIRGIMENRYPLRYNQKIKQQEIKEEEEKEPNQYFSEVHYKQEIKPSEQLNVFADIINNIKNSNGDAATSESNNEEIYVKRKPSRFNPNHYHNQNQNKNRYSKIRTTPKPFLPTPLPTERKRKLPMRILEEHKDADEIIIVKKPPPIHRNPPTKRKQEKPKEDSLEEIASSDQMEKFIYNGLRPPPKEPYRHPNFYNRNPELNQISNKRRRIKRNRGSTLYSEIRRNKNETAEEVDDYVPHRNRNFHYDEKTGKIVYNKPEKKEEEEEVEYDYVEVREEATHPPVKKKEIKRFPPTPPPGPSYLDYIKILKSNPNYTIIEDPKEEKDKKEGEDNTENAVTSSETNNASTGLPEYLSILKKLKEDKSYKVYLDPDPKMKNNSNKKNENVNNENMNNENMNNEDDQEVKSTKRDEEIEDAEIKEEIQNSPGVQGILGLDSPLPVFDISEFVPKTKDYSPKTSIDTSKYTNIRRNPAPKKPQDEEPEVLTTTPQSQTIEIPTTSSKPTTPIIIESRKRTNSSPRRRIISETTTTLKPRRLSQRGRSRFRSTTEKSKNLDENIRNRRNLHRRNYEIPRNHRRDYSIKSRNDIEVFTPTPRSITLNVINQTDFLKLKPSKRINQNDDFNHPENVEVFKDADTNKKNGGNYKFKKVQIKITRNYKPDGEENKESNDNDESEKYFKDVKKSDHKIIPKDFFEDPKLAERINTLKERNNFEITETFFQEENIPDDDDDEEEKYERTTQKVLTTTRRVPKIIKDPSKRLYFYAPI